MSTFPTAKMSTQTIIHWMLHDISCWGRESAQGHWDGPDRVIAWLCHRKHHKNVNVSERHVNGEWMVNEWWMNGEWMVNEWWRCLSAQLTQLTQLTQLIFSTTTRIVWSHFPWRVGKTSSSAMRRSNDCKSWRNCMCCGTFRTQRGLRTGSDMWNLRIGGNVYDPKRDPNLFRQDDSGGSQSASPWELANQK